MIGMLCGKVVDVQPDMALLNVNGIGYEVAITIPHAADLVVEDKDVTFHIHTHVREDTLSLFGFPSLVGRDVFRALIRISGVGPKVGLAILSNYTPEDLAARSRLKESKYLSSVPGIGPKTAAKIHLELKDLLAKVEVDETAVGAVGGGPIATEVIGALTGLGYKQAAAEKAVAAVDLSGLTVEKAVVKALKAVNS